MGYKIYKHLITTNYRGIADKIKLAQKNKPNERKRNRKPSKQNNN